MNSSRILTFLGASSLVLGLGALQACSSDEGDDDASSSSGSSSGNRSDATTTRPDGSSSGGSSTSSGGSSSGGADGGLEATYCSEITARDQECGLQGDEQQGPDCADDFACSAANLRPEALEPLYSCLGTRDCETSEDYCYVQTATAFAGSLGSFVEDCNAKRAECTPDGGEAPFIDDWCSASTAIAKDEIIAAEKACLNESCGEIQDCFIEATAALKCD